MSSWGWNSEHKLRAFGFGGGWIKAMVAISPYLTIILLLLMFHMIGGTLATSKGVLFELPVDADGGKDALSTKLVALVVPSARDTLVFFDDTRYLIDDPTSFRLLGETIGESAAHRKEKSLMILADRRVASGDLMRLIELVRGNGVERVLLAEKKVGVDE